MGKKTGFWETFILIAIILVIIQTFLEDFSVVDNWPVYIRNILILTGLFFDLLFTIEFIVRQLIALKRKKGIHYFIRERGWIDFFSSIPLLLLNSGPQTLLLLSGNDYMSVEIGALNLMKIIKSVRVTRILRFIRMIKLFGKIHNAESIMAQRHITRISSMAVVIIIIVLMIGSFIGGSFSYNDIKEIKNKEYIAFLQSTRKIADSNSTGYNNSKILYLLKSKSDFLFMQNPDGTYIKNIDETKFKEYYNKTDFFRVKFQDSMIFVSLQNENKKEAWQNLIFLFLIIVLVMAFMFFYTKHFVQTVSDVVHVMRRGMEEPEYNLAVKINPLYSNDEIYELAKLYNDQWLTVKDKYRPLGERDASTSVNLSMEDFLGISSDK